MAGLIHPTAIVAPGAQLADDVSVGPYSIIGEHVSIAAGSVVGPHCVIDGHTTIGRKNTFYRHCSIGGIPQDKKYNGEPTRLEIGDGNMVREFVTLNTGTAQDVGVTRLGDDNWIMAYVHVAHDCQIGSHTVIANGVQLAGHIHIGDWAILGGLSAVHQFVRIGAHAMIGGTSSIRQDIPPYLIGAGDPFRPVGVNSEGLGRRGYTPEAIAALKEAYKLLYRRNLKVEEACEQMRNLQDERPEAREAVQVMIDFLTGSSRGIARL
ncbi:acyl-ACP--UDP-N-acetylglucosamine O-acyltransferase [Pollutimonas thiosulfatoxidans]|uniref:Acyl-[acyl-carrier-protein]--UDP-N-acetylglucosamine O-acyltransferase n=1 Tax=Pollutimonas thiosulfatoxidans TaxID=2028345 RepID=A0A410GAX9_9BURK|nr:acyl-ACP--UDP-N-acetylglucosamine O-acyltransferase [Pollutimonas thiosulfatoxidans]MBF6616316.1 acyl-ACP--UDP-N-acetylglucosamine O-acyltransferase [Candidimonas sp.]NYT45974.1 acyl-ACP--UDP-N-acetylglucosamine O-acyltransferase [Alcaligenaceae bacterium]QAA93444.1 acyl-[acyl-carrier-protein]--UDP-N-acetylglucosamine O-acyltransferase [Pollutimonas thiosulfatoxidans]